ncbi:MAG: OmpA family protein [Micavibrio aeruginosavorus]|uniref:OmpA family protein n=1 Tax=Micavibrio aeruginosavorus TaxID=349221 RepID=A0A2W5N3K0_9BACT|nr:MAG: OmpA family protein [Micavibrio aeruginosavorus]
MQILRGLMIVAGVMALGACDFNKFDEVDALNEAQPVGSPFTQKLTAEYRDFVDAEKGSMKDHADALHFARKGLASARGDVVMPEPLGDWNIQPEFMDELSTGRNRMIAMFDLGAREMYPDVSAVAQSRYDCWMEQQEENFQPDDINRCKREFLAALEQLEGAMPAAPPAAPAPAPADNPLNVDPNAPMAVENAMYLVFFDWDQSTLGPGAQSVLDAVAAEASKRSLNAINVVGHADRSGPNDYNQKLGMRRANAVRDALAQRGIAANIINVSSRGEDERLVETPDNVREPANRRAQISFQ